MTDGWRYCNQQVSINQLYLQEYLKLPGYFTHDNSKYSYGSSLQHAQYAFKYVVYSDSRGIQPAVLQVRPRGSGYLINLNVVITFFSLPHLNY